MSHTDKRNYARTLLIFKLKEGYPNGLDYLAHYQLYEDFSFIYENISLDDFAGYFREAALDLYENEFIDLKITNTIDKYSNKSILMSPKLKPKGMDLLEKKELSKFLDEFNIKEQLSKSIISSSITTLLKAVFLK